MKTLNGKLLFVMVLFVFNFFFANVSLAVVTRDEMMSMAESYKNYVWTPTEDNACHKVTKTALEEVCCAERNKKRECVKWRDCRIDTPDRNNYAEWADDRGWEWEKIGENYAANTSVPYNWGGFSSLAEFKKGTEGEAKNRLCAGNIYTVGRIEPGTVGVDCSGFVSRVWGLEKKESTSTLPKISRKLEEYDDLQKGDILNVKYSHVMLFKEFLGPSPYENLRVYESMGFYWKVRSSDYNIKDELKKDKYLPYTYFKSMDVDLVIDRSGSMSWVNMLNAKNAAKQFIDYMQSGHKIGVTSFASSAIANYQLTEIDGSKPSVVKANAKAAIESLAVGGMTSIGAGLQVGQNQLKAYGAEKSEKAIILMSDGWENTPPMAANILPGIISDKIKVCTVGLGFNSDMELLNNIAQQTGCAYKFAATAEALQEIYQDLWSEISGEDIIKKIKEKIKPAYTITKFVYLDSSVHSATFSLSWPGSNIDLTLVDPDGNEINHNTNDPDIEFTEGDTYEFYRINNPMAGEWRLNFYGRDIPSSEEDFVFTLSGINGLIFEAELDKAEYYQQEYIKITASVQDPIMDIDDPQYVNEASFDVIATYPDQSVSSFQLFDDGNHGDGGASDGIYANIFNGAQLSGSYTFAIKAKGATNRNGDLFAREKTISTFVKKSEKKNVVIFIPSRQGFAFDEIAIEAEVKDEQGEPLTGNYNEIIFKVNDEIKGSAIIDNSGKAEILWAVDLIPVNLTETYYITASFAGNEYYFSAEGRGELVLQSAKRLKQDTLAKLKIVKSDNKQIQKEIDKAIKNIEESLNQELWIDASRLEQQHGHKVFDNEKQAIKSLLKIIEEKGNRHGLEIAPELQIIINNLAKIDVLLAKVAIYDLESMEIIDVDLLKKINDKISKAKEELEKALRELIDNNPDKAIDYLKKSWKLAQCLFYC